LLRALDEARFGPARTLDLRTGLPTAAAARRRAEPWLRERQLARAGRVLIITGRGHGSAGGMGIVRREIEVLLAGLRRSGVVSSVHQHTPGSFVVELAPISALFKVIPRTRRPVSRPRVDAAGLAGLQPDIRRELRRLSELALAQLGVPASRAFVEDEMLRQFSILASGISPDEPDREGRLRFMIKASQASLEDES
jgi:hypothetical protein